MGREGMRTYIQVLLVGDLYTSGWLMTKRICHPKSTPHSAGPNLATSKTSSSPKPVDTGPHTDSASRSGTHNSHSWVSAT